GATGPRAGTSRSAPPAAEGGPTYRVPPRPPRRGADPAMTQQTTGRGELVAQQLAAVAANVERVIQGKPEVVEHLLLCLVSEGHLLIEDVPGVGKTSLAKALAASIDGTFGRLQFTPDLLPTDVVGLSMWNRNTSELEFRPGPIFNHVVLADEINRASPKTQSALLEAM